uniref:Uncharacterized protein n=1 Tax=Ditylum brightwellii TaxID=49249 RepID=A0A7S4QRC4_9STRA
MGSITSTSTISSHQSTRLILIVIHGSARNADDYLCSASVLPHLSQHEYDPNSILVLSPWFLAPTDTTNTTLSFPNNALKWNDVGPIAHTFRYGANDSFFNKISSYRAMDEMVETIMRNKDERFPLLERIVVVGHSAGGQFVQRWALTSSSNVWGDDLETHLQQQQQRELDELRQNENRHKNAVQLRAIVANPRSFAYLDARRFLNGTYQLPPKEMMHSCPGYDEWEWGLKPGGPLAVSYISNSLSSFHSKQQMIDRYMKRNVIYLAGAKDDTTVTASCEDDEFQGRSRLERSANFYAALNILSGERGESVRHVRLVVDGVGHDHTLMFQSDLGLEAIFGDLFLEEEDYELEVDVEEVEL